MAVKIRFSRIGKKHAPVFKIVAVDSRKKRDGEYLENLGTYDPISHKIEQFHEERLQHWVSNGAVLTDSVKRVYKTFKNGQSASEVKKEISAPKVESKSE